ncbi:MAG: pantoate--beta-alanine ligase [Bacteroidia bacterium]|nr:pantoate--beta-alanine ligase [Bacteroidia bacterium]
MELVHTISEIRSNINFQKQKGQTIGFVPTMGALHEGHLSLVRRAKSECDIVVTSIYVNPAQFNDPNDLKKYPRTLESDLELLKKEQCELVFTPTETEISGSEKPDVSQYDFGQLESVMEGKFRQGHFKGVAYIVHSLFDIITPDKAYFGEKDFQQLTIIQELVKIYNLPVEIVPCSTIRESDGLAMSSRNINLSEEERKTALLLSSSLYQSKELANSLSPLKVKDQIIKELQSNDHLQLEYFDIIDAKKLQPINEWNESNQVRACIAAYVGNIRLIDNMKIIP